VLSRLLQHRSVCQPLEVQLQRIHAPTVELRPPIPAIETVAWLAARRADTNAYMRASCYGQQEKYDCWGDRRKLVAGAQCPRALDAAVRRGPFIECGYELRLGGTQTPILSVFEIFERLPETNDVCLSYSGGKHPNDVS